MSNTAKMSEAASLAMHAMVFLAVEPDRALSAGKIASALQASEAHLSKVMQRLSRAGLVRSVRGPGGGFVLQKHAGKTTLLEVYESVDGKLKANNCLFGKPICGGRKCILGGLLKSVNRQVREYLARTRLSQLTGVYRSKNARSQKNNQNRRGEVRRLRPVRSRVRGRRNPDR
ncbi:MAG: Rrf2 family transcriptional regulator [Planctomycetota bacterium]